MGGIIEAFGELTTQQAILVSLVVIMSPIAFIILLNLAAVVVLFILCIFAAIGAAGFFLVLMISDWYCKSKGQVNSLRTPIKMNRRFTDRHPEIPMNRRSTDHHNRRKGDRKEPPPYKK